MNELMKPDRRPEIMAMEMAAEALKLAEQLEESQTLNAVLLMQVDIQQGELHRAHMREEILRAERDDARHERDELRKRRDRAYYSVISGNKRRNAKRKSWIKSFLLKGVCASISVLMLFVLGSKAVNWIRYWMGL